MKKNSYPLPRIQEAFESLVGAGNFFYLDLKLRFWQIKMEEASKQYTAFTVGNLGFFKYDCTPFELCNVLVQPSDANLKAIAECVLPQTYTEIQAFLGLIGHCRLFIKGFAWSAQLLNEHLAGERANRKSEQVSLSEDALEAFQAMKQACMSSPVPALADYMKDFLLKTDASKEGLGALLSPKQTDGHYHPVAYGSQALTAHEKNYYSTKLEILALK